MFPWRDRSGDPQRELLSGAGKRAKREHTLFGSLTRTYFPSGCFMHKSMIALMIPHPLASETFS